MPADNAVTTHIPLVSASVEPGRAQDISGVDEIILRYHSPSRRLRHMTRRGSPECGASRPLHPNAWSPLLDRGLRLAISLSASAPVKELPTSVEPANEEDA